MPYKKITKNTHPIDEIPPDTFAEIGKIVAWWGYLQFQLGAIIREISNLPKDTGRVLTVGPDLSVLCNIIRTFTKSDHWIKDENIRADLEKLAKDVRDKSSDRNDYAHGVFGYGENPNEFVRFLMKQPEHRIKPYAEPLKVDDLKKIANDARGLWIRAQDITERLKSSRKKRH